MNARRPKIAMTAAIAQDLTYVGAKDLLPTLNSDLMGHGFHIPSRDNPGIVIEWDAESQKPRILAVPFDRHMIIPKFEYDQNGARTGLELPIGIRSGSNTYTQPRATQVFLDAARARCSAPGEMAAFVAKKLGSNSHHTHSTVPGCSTSTLEGTNDAIKFIHRQILAMN